MFKWNLNWKITWNKLKNYPYKIYFWSGIHGIVMASTKSWICSQSSTSRVYNAIKLHKQFKFPFLKSDSTDSWEFSTVAMQWNFLTSNALPTFPLVFPVFQAHLHKYYVLFNINLHFCFLFCQPLSSNLPVSLC